MYTIYLTNIPRLEQCDNSVRLTLIIYCNGSNTWWSFFSHQHMVTLSMKRQWSVHISATSCPHPKDIIQYVLHNFICPPIRKVLTCISNVEGVSTKLPSEFLKFQWLRDNQGSILTDLCTNKLRCLACLPSLGRNVVYFKLVADPLRTNIWLHNK